LRTFVRDWLLDPDHSDSAIAGFLQGEEADDEEAFSIILNNTVCRALAYFDFALQTGEAELVETARQLLSTSQQIAADAGAVPLWWIIRLCRNFIDDLWQHSLHSKLPISPPNGGEESYAALREKFLALLYRRKVSEVELWPSQIEATERSTDVTDDLIVALPTSAGKTRIGEIAALMALSTGKRVLIVTCPNRAFVPSYICTAWIYRFIALRRERSICER
jgi:hypothetical protein